MTRSIKDKFLVVLALAIFGFGFASDGPGGPCWDCPEQANPIDMYVYVLMAIGALFIAFFGKRLMKSKV